MGLITSAQIGEVLYFGPEEMPILVVMAGDDGIRFIDPMQPEFDKDNKLITRYASYATLGEWTISLGTVENIVKTKIGKSK